MQTMIHGRNVEVNDRVREYVDKKVGKLERYLPKVHEARVELSHNATRASADRYTAQITIWSNGQILRTEESTSDIFASIDASVDKMYRQIERFKGKRYLGKRRASAAANAQVEIAATAVAEEVAEEEGGRIIRRKEFALQPMNEDEAIEQMELLGHDFFVYFDVEAQNIQVLYRRKDGDYGLLRPTIG
jgi:putative sigma-54 modulation protein